MTKITTTREYTKQNGYGQGLFDIKIRTVDSKIVSASIAMPETVSVELLQLLSRDLKELATVIGEIEKNK